MGRRINTVMQTCFFAISGILPQDEAIAAIKHAVEKSYGRKGRRIAELNFRAIDRTLASLHEITVPAAADADEAPAAPPLAASDFVRRVTLPLIAGRGDTLPVSVFPVDGTWPTGTARYEKRNLALQIRCSRPTCAPSAASASSSARIRRSAPRPSRPTWPRRRRPPSSTWPSAARITRPAGA
jgi:hypothetical protein